MATMLLVITYYSWNRVTIIVRTDQLNITIQTSVKSTPYELVFGQPPRKTVFPGVTYILLVLQWKKMYLI